MENKEKPSKEIDPAKEAHAAEYYKDLRDAVHAHENGEPDRSHLDEEILDELDKEMEPKLEECLPHLFIKRIKGTTFLVWDRHRLDELIEEKYKDK